MNKKIAKHVVAFSLSLLMVTMIFAYAVTVNAQGNTDNMLWGGQQGAVQAQTGLGNTDPRAMAARAINILLGFMGIIAVVIILLGGFRWMTAAGNEDKVAEAKKIIGAGVIGLVIILTSFGLAQFILNALYNATGASG
jgi:hypothetical protein